MNPNPTNHKATKTEHFATVAAYIRKMQPREKMLALIAFFAFVIIGGNELMSSVTETFEDQQARLDKITSEMDLVSAALSRFTTLKQRQRAVEEAYKEVEFEGPALSYLEKLLKEKAGIASGFTIRDKPSRQFGGDYEQTPYTIKFTTVDMNRLVEFLKELTEGSRPVLLASLNLKPKPGKDSIDVELEISSIKRITQKT